MMSGKIVTVVNVVNAVNAPDIGNMPVAGLLSGRTTFRSRHTDFCVRSGAFCSVVFYRAELFNINHILSRTLVLFDEIN